MSDVEFHLDRDQLAAEISESRSTPPSKRRLRRRAADVHGGRGGSALGQLSPGGFRRLQGIRHGQTRRQGRPGAVGTSIGYAHLIEYGSNDTPEFAPPEKTAASFSNGSSGDYGKTS